MCLGKSFQEANFSINLNSDNDLLLVHIFEACVTKLLIHLVRYHQAITFV